MNRRNLFLALGLGVLIVVGCSKEDPRHQKLVGTWKDGHGTVITLRDDGDYWADIDTTVDPRLKKLAIPASVHMTGSWKIVGNDFAYDISDSTWKSDRLIGKSSAEHIDHVEDALFTTTNATDGKVNSYTRVR